MVGLIVVGAGCYVLGAKHGRGRYEQIAKAARTVRDSQVAQKLVEVTRQKLSDSLNTRPVLEPLEPLDERTTLLVPQEQLRRTS